MPINEYRPFAAGAGANTLSPADYGALAARTSGFSSGIADSTQCNTPWRQATVGVAGLAQFIADVTGLDMLDDGSPNNFQTKFIGALNLVVAAAVDASGSFGSGGIFGFIMSNTPAFTTTRITMTPGQCRNSLNNANIVTSVPFTKRLDTVWSPGDNGGGRDVGVLANGQTWHLFMIMNATTLAVDALFSQSPTAPALPAGYTKFRRVGAVILESTSTQIRQFLQTGDWFSLKLRSTDYAAQANGGAPFLRLVTVPQGIKVEAKFYFQSVGTQDANVYLSGVYDPDFGVPPAFGPATQWAQVRRFAVAVFAGGYASFNTVVFTQFTDSARQVYTYSSDGGDVIALGVLGWRDDRGRFF